MPNAQQSYGNVAVRKYKTGHTSFRAGQFREADAVDKLIKFDDGYQILKEVRGSLIGRRHGKMSML